MNVSSCGKNFRAALGFLSGRMTSPADLVAHLPDGEDSLLRLMEAKPAASNKAPWGCER